GEAGQDAPANGRPGVALTGNRRGLAADRRGVALVPGSYRAGCEHHARHQAHHHHRPPPLHTTSSGALLPRDSRLAHSAGPRYSVRTIASAGSSCSRWARARSTYSGSFDSSVSFTVYSGWLSLGYEPSNSSGNAARVAFRCSAIVPSPSLV